jgi:MOSC domain-containing protein YiiM
VTYEMKLVGVSIGGTQRIARHRGRDVYSSIARRPVSESEIYLTRTGLAGDQPTDTRPHKGGQMHGGHDKAVYAYPVEHYPAWRHEIEGLLSVPSFGENLTLRSVSESDVRVGDVWAWGDALLQITKPRQPCVTLEIYLKTPGIIKRMAANGRCGWYLSVNRAGVVPVAGPITLVSTDPAAPTIAEVFAAKMSRS